MISHFCVAEFYEKMNSFNRIKQFSYHTCTSYRTFLASSQDKNTAKAIESMLRQGGGL